MSGAVGDEETHTKWAYSTWWVEEQSDASTWRHTLKYRVLPTLQLGVEVNAKTGDVEPLVTWLAIQETDTTPAVILGSGTNGVATPGSADDDSERIFHMTLAKHLFDVGPVSVSPYASLIYLGETDEFAGVYGVNLGMPLNDEGDSASLQYFFDGDDHSVVITYHHRSRHSIGLIVKKMESLGVSYSFAF